VQGLTNVSQLQSRGDHSCALAGTTVSCWGANGNDQLGDGTQTNRNAPVQALTGAAEIAVGWDASCARKTDGTVWCWGYGGWGMLGDGTYSSRATPVQVSGIASATHVAAGGAHACALVSGGMVACWGQDNIGQLGDGQLFSRVPLTVRMQCP